MTFALHAGSRAAASFLTHQLTSVAPRAATSTLSSIPATLSMRGFQQRGCFSSRGGTQDCEIVLSRIERFSSYQPAPLLILLSSQVEQKVHETAEAYFERRYGVDQKSHKTALFPGREYDCYEFARREGPHLPVVAIRDKFTRQRLPVLHVSQETLEKVHATMASYFGVELSYDKHLLTALFSPRVQYQSYELVKRGQLNTTYIIKVQGNSDLLQRPVTPLITPPDCLSTKVTIVAQRRGVAKASEELDFMRRAHENDEDVPFLSFLQSPTFCSLKVSEPITKPQEGEIEHYRLTK